MQRIRSRLTYANVVSSLALLLALGGTTAFAASQLAKNSVGARQLKKGAVTTKKLKKGAVKGAKVADGSLTGNDINARTLGTVPNADRADHASRADRAGNADTASGLTTLPSGKSESGGFSLGGVPGELISEAITFVQPLASPIPEGNVELIEQNMPFTGNCPGPGRAAPNHLCIYDHEDVSVFDPRVTDFFNESGSGTTGFRIIWRVEATLPRVFGQWTVTAP